ncbi:MAG: alpha/beta hydrolase [Pseudomonadota bacterium]
MTLILIPGHMCGPWLYQPQLAAFPEAHIADVTQDDSVAGMASRVLRDHPGQLVLAGLSLGGMVAMEAMAEAPERISGVCLMATDPTAAREREIAWRQSLVLEGLAPYRQTFVKQFFRHNEDVAERLGPKTLAQMAETPEHVTRAQIRALDTRREMIALIDRYSGPAEIVVGTEDRVCPPKLHRALTEALPNADLTEIQGAGHIATLEAADVCTSAISRLLARIST